MTNAPAQRGKSAKGIMPEGINKDTFILSQNEDESVEPVLFIAAQIITSGYERTAWVNIYRPEFPGARDGIQQLTYPIKPRESEVTVQNRMFSQASTLITHGTVYWTWPNVKNIKFSSVDGKDGLIKFVEIGAEENPAQQQVKQRVEAYYLGRN